MAQRTREEAISLIEVEMARDLEDATHCKRELQARAKRGEITAEMLAEGMYRIAETQLICRDQALAEAKAVMSRGLLLIKD